METHIVRLYQTDRQQPEKSYREYLQSDDNVLKQISLYNDAIPYNRRLYIPDKKAGEKSLIEAGFIHAKERPLSSERWITGVFRIITDQIYI